MKFDEKSKKTSTRGRPSQEPHIKIKILEFSSSKQKLSVKNNLPLPFSLITKNSNGVEVVAPIIKGKERRIDCNLLDIIIRFECKQVIPSHLDLASTSFARH